MNKLIICLSSYSPYGYSFIEKYNRQELYAIALWNLVRTVSNETDICIVENTITEKEIENEKLKEILNDKKIKYKFFTNKNDLGAKNKGAGELQMCKDVLINLSEKFKYYEWVIYYTSRHIIFNIESIEKSINQNNFDIFVGNPNYILSDGSTVPVAPNNYNDMLFIMKSSLFKNYCFNADPKQLVKDKMNSEKYLFDFINSRKKEKVKIFDLNEIPLVRYDYSTKEMHLVSNIGDSFKNFNLVLEIYLEFYKNFNQEIQEYKDLKPDTIVITNSIFRKILGKIFGQIVLTYNQYKYNIEPTWDLICQRILKKKKYKIILPMEIDMSKIYQFRINNCEKLIWK